MRVVIATGNKGKLKELSELLTPMGFEVLSPKDCGIEGFDVVEDGDTFEENALIKARAYSIKTGIAAISDDSGLAVDALMGAPGIYSARYGGEGLDDAGRIAHLLENMKDIPKDERTARFVSALAFASDKREFAVRGECEGVIIDAPIGEGGFGYDPVFLYEPDGLTFGEITKERKNEISHRAVAMRTFREMLKEVIG